MISTHLQTRHDGIKENAVDPDLHAGKVGEALETLSGSQGTRKQGVLSSGIGVARHLPCLDQFNMLVHHNLYQLLKTSLPVPLVPRKSYGEKTLSEVLTCWTQYLLDLVNQPCLEL